MFFFLSSRFKLLSIFIHSKKYIDIPDFVVFFLFIHFFFVYTIYINIKSVIFLMHILMYSSRFEMNRYLNLKKCFIKCRLWLSYKRLYFMLFKRTVSDCISTVQNVFFDNCCCLVSAFFEISLRTQMRCTNCKISKLMFVITTQRTCTS